nr:hypothetical protein [Deltaproteobacteria bacterium]
MPTKPKGSAAPKSEPAPAPAKVKAAEPAKTRPSELVIPAPAKTRPSEPKLDVLAAAAKAKPLEAPKARPSEPRLDVLAVAAKSKPLDPPKAKLEPIVAAPPKAKPVESAKNKLPAEWKALIGKPLTCSWRRSSGHMIEVIDWAKLRDRMTWLDDVFGDCDTSKHFVGLISAKHGSLEWVSGSMLPVALLGQQHGGEGQLEAILLIDTATSDSPIFAIEVDGTAIPAKKPQQVAANLAALKIEIVKPEAKAKAARVGADFDTKRPLIASGKMAGDARKVLAALTGDKDGGASYLDVNVTKKPKPPEGRDPRWIEALRDELAKSMVFASTGYQSETYWFAGALASFGQAAIPALVSGFETALKSYPKKSLGYGVKPVLDAFDSLHSDAGVPLALDIISRADKPEKSWAIPP